MNHQSNSVERVIGFDSHPDTFTAAILRGPTPAAAHVEQVFNKVPLSQLASWARKHTQPSDLLVMEASGNSFAVVRHLAAAQRQAKVLESCHLGKLKEAHANNDKISAVRIGKAYLAGTAKEVWVPDVRTQERRDWFHAHRKAVKRLTQIQARLRSYLSDNGVRLKPGLRLTQAGEVEEQIRQAHDWSARQWQVLQGLLLELRHADQQRQHWRSLIAQEVLNDPQLLKLVRLGGVREMVAFALGAFIGDIHRFAHPKQLVKYVGLNPAFDDSGQETWHGGIGGHGNKHLRCLLIEGAQAILRCSHGSLAKWGRKLLARKGAVNLAVAAIARKLTVSVWYLLMGRWTPLEEVDQKLAAKLSTILRHVGPEGLKSLGLKANELKEQACQRLKADPASAPAAPEQAPPQASPPLAGQAPATRCYFLDPRKRFTPKAPASRPALEYVVQGV